MQSKNIQKLKLSLIIAAALIGGFFSRASTVLANYNGRPYANLPSQGLVMDCGNLIWMSQKLSDMANVPLQVQSAAVVATDEPASYCDVKGYVSPMVGFEVKLPTATWTQRYLQVGCGAFCGTIAIQVPNTGSMGNAQIDRGELAMAATDMGHPTNDGLDGTWLADDPQLRVDFAYRAAHVTAIALGGGFDPDVLRTMGVVFIFHGHFARRARRIGGVAKATRKTLTGSSAELPR